MDQVAYPKKLTIALTDRCNLKCFICSRDEAEQSWNSKGVHMGPAELHKMENAIRYAEMISLSGFGETFLYPQLPEVLDYIYALNPRDNLIMFISNGTALSYAHGKKLGSRLRELVISLNAANPDAYQRDMHPEVNRLDYEGNPDPRVRLEKLDGRGLSQFGKTCGKIRDFLRALEPTDRAKVRLHYVVHRDNMSEMEDFVLLARELGCSTVGFYQYMVTQESRIKYSIFFHQDAYNECFDRAQNLGRLLGVKVDGARFGGGSSPEFNKESSCTSPFDEAIVYTSGSVSPCCHAGSENLGNAFTAGFDSVWFGQKYRMLREERHLNGCQTCNLYRSINDVEVHFHPVVKTTARYRKSLGKLAEAATRNPLNVVIVGAGADGSRTLWSLVKSLYSANGVDARVAHLADSYTVADAVMNYVTRRDSDFSAKVLGAWKNEAVVGNGFAFIMPALRAAFGSDLKIIHLKRSPEAGVRALVRQAELYPQHWGGYVPLPVAHDIIRPTARHFSEMSAAEWGRLGLKGRLAWYYEKSHGLIEEARTEFPNWLEVATESLSDPSTISQIAFFIDREWRSDVPPVHLNAAAIFDLAAVADPYDRIRLSRMLRDFDVDQAISSETYAIGYFVQAMRDTPIGRLRTDKEAAGKLILVKRKIDDWIVAARRFQPSRLPLQRAETQLRIRNPALSPEKQIALERLLRGFDINEMAANETYAATFFIERLVAPHSGNPAMYAPLAEALQPISNLLRQIVLDCDADALTDEVIPNSEEPQNVTAA